MECALAPVRDGGPPERTTPRETARRRSGVDEEALMASYARGDDSAFSELFRSLARPLHRFLWRRFGSETVADDLLQQTFLRLHRARYEYRAGGPVRPWVFKIALRVGLDEMRKRVRRPIAADGKRLERTAQSAGARVDTDPVERAELCERVSAAIDTLPEKQRVVVHLHRYGGLTFGQIAEIVGASESAVKLRAFRAYGRLRTKLAPLMRELAS